MATARLVTLEEVGLAIHQVLVDNDTITGESAGDTVHYTIAITNEGTTTLSAIAVTSSLMGDEFVCDPVLEALRLSPAATVNCTAVAEVRNNSSFTTGSCCED